MKRYVFPTMGTVGNLYYPEQHANFTLEADLLNVFNRYEEKYSLYDEGSELSRVARHEIPLAEASDDIRDNFAEAMEWYLATDSIFTPFNAEGSLDLDGIIKAKALVDAKQILLTREVSDWSLNVGGDVTVSGLDPQDNAWLIGIVHPVDKRSLGATVMLDDRYANVATSGFSERGEHIWSARGSEQQIQQTSVIAKDMLLADVLATTIIAGGDLTCITELDRRYDVGILAYTKDGRTITNDLMRSKLV